MNRILLAVRASMLGPARRAVPLILLYAILGVGVFAFSVPSYGQDGLPDFSGIWRRDSFRLVPPYMFDDGVEHDRCGRVV